MTRVRAAILGATGYSGGELVALLARHPSAELVALQGSAGRKEPVPFGALHPSLRGTAGPRCEALSLEALRAARPDVVFLSTPNESAAELAVQIVPYAKVIDLSGAHRLRDAASHARWYGFDHPHPSMLELARYSVPELLDAAGVAALRGAKLIANPGCYATSVILALQPILGLLAQGEVVIADCKSGATGAGKRTELAYSFTEVVGNFKAYAVSGHRHEPEMRLALGFSAERPFVFVPHLLPVARGILSTLYVAFERGVDAASLSAAYAKAYANKPFVGVRTDGRLPELSDAVGTPRCELGFQVLPGGRRGVVVSVLDNLLKGAASQAVQNFNLACGLPETEGLL